MECTRGSERAALSLSTRVRKLFPALSRRVARLRWLTLRYSCLVCTSGVADIASLKGDWFKVLGLDERCLPLSLFLPPSEKMAASLKSLPRSALLNP